MASSLIEWTDVTWNPVTGCTKVSLGCKHCYAERMARRLQGMGHPNYRNGFRLTIHEHMLALPLQWRRPRRVFVNSMSDLFHQDVPDTFIERVFRTMAQAHWHVFQVLTKRAERLAKLAPDLFWPQNVWMGVTVEHDATRLRLDLLRSVPAAVRFVSFEPLIGRVRSPDLTGIDWVIVGGESGPNARPMDPEWVDEIYEACQAFEIPFFFKQWGGIRRRRAGRLFRGRVWDEYPRTDAGSGISDRNKAMPGHAYGM